MLVINGLDGSTLAELQANAAQNGRCLDAEIAFILTAHVHNLRSSGSAKRASSAEIVRVPPVRGTRSRAPSGEQLNHVADDTYERVTPMQSGLRMLLDIPCGLGGADI